MQILLIIWIILQSECELPTLWTFTSMSGQLLIQMPSEYFCKQNWDIRSVSENTIIRHETGIYFILNFTIEWGIGLFSSLFGEIHMRQGGPGVAWGVFVLYLR